MQAASASPYLSDQEGFKFLYMWHKAFEIHQMRDSWSSRRPVEGGLWRHWKSATWCMCVLASLEERPQLPSAPPGTVRSNAGKCSTALQRTVCKVSEGLKESWGVRCWAPGLRVQHSIIERNPAKSLCRQCAKPGLLYVLFFFFFYYEIGNTWEMFVGKQSNDCVYTCE